MSPIRRYRCKFKGFMSMRGPDWIDKSVSNSKTVKRLSEIGPNWEDFETKQIGSKSQNGHFYLIYAFLDFFTKDLATFILIFFYSNHEEQPRSYELD